MRSHVSTGLLAAALLLSPLAARAQDAMSYPVKPVRVIVALPPGGATDLQARMFAAKLSEVFGRQFIVENRPGAGSIAGYTAAAMAPPDGYTLLAVGLTFTSGPALRKDHAIDPIRDYAPVSLVIKAPWLLTVHPSLPVKSVRDLIALARAKPDTLNFGGGALGAGTHLLAEWFIQANNLKAEFIPYSSGGTGQAIADVVAGRVDAAIVTILTAKPYLPSNRLRALAVTTAQRSKVMPNLPTIAEQGVPGYDGFTFHGWLAPAGTPPAIVNRLSAELAKIAAAPDVAERIRDDGGEAAGMTPEQFREFIAAEVSRWNSIVRKSGLKLAP